VFYSNFVPKTFLRVFRPKKNQVFEIPVFNLIVTCSLKPGLGSLKVIRTDMDRSATYELLLAFQRSHGPISYHFWHRRRFQSKISKLAMRMRGITWPVSGGCKIITYLESKTPSFLLTVQHSSGYNERVVYYPALSSLSVFRPKSIRVTGSPSR